MVFGGLFKQSNKQEAKDDFINAMATALVTSLKNISPELNVGARQQIVEALKRPVQSIVLDKSINNAIEKYQKISSQSRDVRELRQSVAQTPEYTAAEVAVSGLLARGRDYMDIFKQAQLLEQKREMLRESDHLSKMEVKQGASVPEAKLKLREEIQALETSIRTTSSKYVATTEKFGKDSNETYARDIADIVQDCKTHASKDYTNVAAQVSVIQGIEKLSSTEMPNVNSRVMASFPMVEKLNMFGNALQQELKAVDLKSQIQANGFSIS